MPPVFGFVAGMVGFAAPAIGSAAFGAWVAGVGFGSNVLGGIVGKLLTTVAMSALQAALQKRSQKGGGLTISTTLRGEQNPETILLGRTATGGQAICPPMSHGPNNVFLTHVIELCSAPGARLDRLILGDAYVELGSVPNPDGYGYPVTTAKYQYKGTPLVHVKYHDGTQTAADPMLLAKYGSHPDRPWTADMVGTGICYAILTFTFNSQTGLTQVPRYRFEMSGIPMYDPRKDGTAGGTGPHRPGDPATWEPTLNPVVAAWNIFRGIPLPGGEVWGGQVEAADLPQAVWFAAMNICDMPETLATGGSEPRYRFGIEAALAQEPAAVLTEILKACAGQVADMGGVWKIRVGGPSLPVYLHSDDDVLVSRPQELDPFPSLSDTWNAVAAQYPDPEALWESRDAPLRTNAAWEAADQFGRRTADLSLPAVPFKLQVQRLMRAWIEDERRFARHVLNLPPDASGLEPLDTTGWSSQRNGYVAKTFDVAEVVEDIRTCIVQLSTREVDPADYAWSPAFELPSLPVTQATTPVAPAAVSGFAVEPAILTDAGGAARRPGLRLAWDADIQADGLVWEIRLAADPAMVLRGTTQDIEAGALIVTTGILPGAAYEVRASLRVDRPAVWTGWLAVAAPDVRLGTADLAAGLAGVFDTVPPDAPTGLVLTSAADMEGAVLTAAWTAPAASDLADHDLMLTEGAANPVIFSTPGTSYAWRVLPGRAFTARVRARDIAGNLSPWSAEVAHTAATDTIAPAVPSGLTATGGFGTIWASWTRGAEHDLSHYEVFAAGSATPPPGTGTAPTWTTAASQLVIEGLAAGTTRHIWIRAVDTSGNRSAWSAPASASAAGLQTGDLMGLIDEGSFRTGVEPVTIIDSGPLPGLRSTSFIQHAGVLYKWSGTTYVPVVSATALSGLVLAGQIDSRGLNILDLFGNAVFSATGEISPDAFVSTGGNTIALSTLAANSLTPSIHFVGEFAVPPTAGSLGADWRQNAVYKNTVDGKAYVLTGSPLAWMQYLSDGNAFYLTIESTNGTVFRVGQASTTLLKARLFKNGAEVTETTPAAWFRWRRVSANPGADSTWNAAYTTGFKQIDVSVDAVAARATFFCDILSS